MNLSFKYSRIYFIELNRYKEVNRTWEEVIRLGAKFEERYKEEIKEIVKIIPKVLNKNWPIDNIPIYMVDRIGPSFSNPLTLKVREDLLLMLVVLVHELIHQFPTFNIHRAGNEKEVNNYTEKLFEELKIDAKEQIAKLREWSEKDN